jgi:hypothetical protein
VALPEPNIVEMVPAMNAVMMTRFSMSPPMCGAASASPRRGGRHAACVGDKA